MEAQDDIVPTSLCRPCKMSTLTESVQNVPGQRVRAVLCHGSVGAAVRRQTCDVAAARVGSGNLYSSSVTVDVASPSPPGPCEVKASLGDGNKLARETISSTRGGKKKVDK